MDLNDIRVFKEVVEQGSFTAAARQLGMPLSTVSRRVSRLEDDLAVRLLQRTTRKLSLTDAGRLYFDSAARSLRDLDEAHRAITERQQTPRGKVRVTGPVDLTVLTTVTTAFLAAYPEVEVDLDFTNRYVDLIAEGYDLAVRAGQLSDSSLVAHKLLDSGMRLVASPDYVARRGSPRTVEALSREHECILFGSGAGWSLAAGSRRERIPVRGRLTVNNMEAAREAALAGFGIALLPETSCAGALRDGRLVSILPEHASRTGSLSVVYPSRRHLSAAVRAYVDYLKAHIAEATHRLEA